MKKLVVMFVAAMAVMMSQAAYVSWSSTGLSDYKSQTFYLFDAANSAAVLSALAAVDDSTATTLSDMALTSGSVTTKGKASVSGLDIGSATEIMAVVVNGDFADGTGFKYITEAIPAGNLYTPPSTPTAGVFNSTLATAGTTGTMQGGGVPEPTSGLLLLVGGAMLALRRKQK